MNDKGVQNNSLASLYNQKVFNLEFCNRIWTQLKFGNKISQLTTQLSKLTLHQQ